MKPSFLLPLALLFGLQISGSERVGVGLGFGQSSKPYSDALNQLRQNGVFVLKTWNINPDWLSAVQSVYSDVSIVVVVVVFFVVFVMGVAVVARVVR
jgi:hypothetical protein